MVLVEGVLAAVGVALEKVSEEASELYHYCRIGLVPLLRGNAVICFHMPIQTMRQHTLSVVEAYSISGRGGE